MSNRSELISFSLAQEVYALPLQKVREIVGLPPITRLPNAPRSLRGVMSLRGSVIPVVDLREQLDLPALSYGKFTVAIIVEAAGVTIGLIVDRVIDVISLAADEIEPLPQSFSPRVRSEFLTGMLHRDGQTLVLLDAERILTDEQRGVLSERPAR